ncbi:uncharacterized protein LOC123193291 [Mangifera indica]|uniref:uncharacterized protein LOC123193291 n=1 Tax=Mangifera indica TaxID=29780 RepID=UPI001CF9504F|nr:uncharacterized protein LOC123193291 [Mangifera indica]
MGKSDQSLRQRQSLEVSNLPSSYGFSCQRCSLVFSVISREFSLKCVVVLLFSLAVSLSWIFWILPLHNFLSGFDAKDAVKLSSTVQASFRLEIPVSEIVPHMERLEYDLYNEIGVPDAEVAILSIHQLGASNWTNVVFGVLPGPINAPINPVYLSVLRSSLIELFLQQSNLTLTASIFGQPSTFQILKFTGGITVIPLQPLSILQITQVLFNFTLNNSISEIEANFLELRDQLKSGLNLRSYENLYVQVTNKEGSTITPPVIVQVSVMSDLGSLLPQRLKQLAQTITESPAKNLGLNNLVFGNVKSVVLSSYLKGTLHATPPTPSPSPSPTPYSPYSLAPSPAPAVAIANPPFFPPTSSPTSNPIPARSSSMCSPQSAPGLPTSPTISYDSSRDHAMGSATAPVSPMISSSAVGLFFKEMWSFRFCGPLLFHMLSWPAILKPTVHSHNNP